jgi:hypothetical protein
MRKDSHRKSALTSLAKKLDGDWWRVILIWIVTMILRYGVSLLVLFCSVNQTFGQTSQQVRSPFKAGEILRYKVKWAFIRLGTVVIRQLPADTTDTTACLAEMSVHSAPALPFINVNFVTETYLTKTSQSVTRETIVSGEDSSERTNYWYDSANLQIVMEDSADGKLVRRDSVEAETPCYDALGLLMLSRGLIGTGQSLTLPTLNDYRIAPTDVSFPDKVEEINVAAVDHPVRCRRVEGVAKWVGTSFAGMKGPFTGWISDDEAAIPLKAEVEIFLGFIVLELESYERPGWSQDCKFADAPANKRKEGEER